MSDDSIANDYHALARQIKGRARGLGFQDLRIAGIDLTRAEERLLAWLERGLQGDMHYLSKHGRKRTRPELLVEGTATVLCARMDYRTEDHENSWSVIGNPSRAYVSRYALGRDYHKVVRRRLQMLASWIGDRVPGVHCRVFCDSAPVMEKPLAEIAGLGWIGKHSNLVNRRSGSWFFLGEIYTNLPLPVDTPAGAHCGSCRACIDICPTDAIIEPYVLDARRCISYLTIENRGSIPVRFRKAMGNRIYGCDDCQLVCPFNRFSKTTAEADFRPRHDLDKATLVSLFRWTKEEFDEKTLGSAIRRIDHEAWLRNIAVALGNAETSSEVVDALRSRVADESPLVREHVRWALEQHGYP